MLVYLIVFIFGLAVGSFLNVVIVRLHEKKNFTKGRSRCPRCHKDIAWYDNIPLLSFVLLGGKCRHCKQKISPQYPVVELATAVLFLLAFLTHSGCLVSIVYCLTTVSNIFLVLRDLVFVSVLIVIFVYDLRWYLIPDSITIPAIVIALSVNGLLGLGWLNMLLAAAIGGGFFLAQFLISRGRWIGGGDIRLGALMGVMLGLPQVGVALFIAYISGAVVGVGLLAAGKKQWSSQVPFGTFLSVATVVALLWGDVILNWYLTLLL